MINKVTLIGNLGGDPEIRHLENGTAVARFSLATHENYKDKDGNWQKNTEWHNIVVWRELADRVSKLLKKGMLVYVEGKISYRKYMGQDNQERYVTDIVANVVRSMERLEGSGADSRFPSTEPSVQPKSNPSPMPAEVDAAPAEGDDLPF